MNRSTDPASIVYDGNLYLTGITARQNLNGDIRNQMREALDILDARLAEAGTDRSTVLTVHIWLNDMTLFQEMTDEWNNWIGTMEPPSRSCVSGTSLCPGALVELVATASIPERDANNAPIERYGIVRGPGRPTMCLALAHRDWFTVCTLASDRSEGISGQTQQILRVFDQYLTESGTEKSKILTMDIWIKNLSDQTLAYATISDWLPQSHRPSGSCVRADMASPDMLIEIRITATRSPAGSNTSPS